MPINKSLELMPLWVEQDRRDFESWFRLESVPDLWWRRSSPAGCWAAVASVKREMSKRCSMIIFLNGVSSSGKSSVARALQDAWMTPLVHVGVDTFIDMLPARFCGEGQQARYGLQFVPIQTPEGQVVEIRPGPYAKRLFAGMIGAIGALARAKNDLIVDEVLFGDDMLRAYIRELRGQTVYFIALHCPRAIVEQRERERGDRFINSARAQFPLVHGPTRCYDLELDTSVSAPDQLAGAIQEYVATTPEPQGFVTMERVFGS